MRVVILFLSISLLVFKTNAQLFMDQYDTLIHRTVIDLYGVGDYSATSVQRGISGTFLRGGLISGEMIDQSYDKHGAVNRIGFEASAEISYTNFTNRILKSKPWGFRVAAGYYNFAGLVYSKDLFGLAFYGNDRFIGDTLSFSGSNLTSMSFQKIGFGLVHERTKSSISMNIYNISQSASAQLRDGRFHQTADSSLIILSMDASIEATQSKQFNQGIGLGFDIQYFMEIDWMKDRTAFIQFSVKNLGVSYLYEKQASYRMDTTLSYDGFTFDELTSGQSWTSDSTDILDSLGLKKTDKQRYAMLPGYLQIAKVISAHNEKPLQSFFGVRMYPTMIYSPYVFAGIDYKATPWIHLGAIMGYGGFSKFRPGVYLELKKGIFSGALATENVWGLLSKNAYGESLILRLTCDIQ